MQPRGGRCGLCRSGTRWRGSRSHTGSHVPVSRYRRSRRTRRRAPPPRSRTRSGTSTAGPGRAARGGMPWYVRFRGIDDMRLSEAPDRGAARFRGIAGRCALPNPVHQTRGAGRKPLAMRKCASGQPRRGLSTSEARRISVRPWGSRRMGRRPTGRCARFRAAGRFRLVRGGGRISRRSCPRNGSRPSPPYS